MIYISYAFKPNHFIMQTDELRMCNGSGDKQIGKKPSRVQYKVNTRERTIEKITRS